MANMVLYIIKKFKISHHGGKAGKCVTYNVPAAKTIEGIVSVGKENGYGHPNGEVMKQIKTYVPKVRMTKDCGDIDVWL